MILELAATAALATSLGAGPGTHIARETDTCQKVTILFDSGLGAYYNGQICGGMKDPGPYRRWFLYVDGQNAITPNFLIFGTRGHG